MGEKNGREPLQTAREFKSFTSIKFQSNQRPHCHSEGLLAEAFAVLIMGGFHSKKRKKTSFEKREIHVRGLTEKIRLLKDEISEREKERWAYEREVMVFALRETEWNQERKKLREEVKRLRKNLEEKEEKIRMMEDGDKDDGDENGSSGSGGYQKKRCHVKDWEVLGTNFLVEQMREERARRDEAVEKWKHLYLAIKTELDDLIHRTRNGLSIYIYIYLFIF